MKYNIFNTSPIHWRLRLLTGVLMLIVLRGNTLCQQSMAFTNTLNSFRTDQPIVISRKTIENKVGKIASNESVQLLSESGATIAAQTDDTDGDGQWDELACILDFKPLETRQISIVPTNTTLAAKVVKRAHVRFAVSRLRNNVFTEVAYESRPTGYMPQSQPPLYQYEGPGWENDKIAFRSYFDARNGKDIFGKQTTAMVLDSVGLNKLKPYHELAPWGMDVLKVGNSLGAGALAILCGDTLFRLGFSRAASYTLIADGPVRAMFKLSYAGVPVANDTVNIDETITIWGGKQCYSSHVALSGSNIENKNLVSGIGALHYIAENPSIAVHYIHKTATAVIVSNVLSENNDALQMGILINNKYYHSLLQTPNEAPSNTIVHTACIKTTADSLHIVDFQFFAGWEKADTRFANSTYLLQLMQAETELNEHPIVVK